MKSVWTKQALRDLAAIHGLIAMDSPFYASLVINTILEVDYENLTKGLATD